MSQPIPVWLFKWNKVGSMDRPGDPISIWEEPTWRGPIDHAGMQNLKVPDDVVAFGGPGNYLAETLSCFQLGWEAAIKNRHKDWL